MQPNTTIVKSMGSLGGTKVAMKFDENSIEHIMSVLTDLYSDPIAAVVREYSTNALDSHKSVGQTRPVEVTLPSQFDPNFRVRDFGIGLSVDDVTNIYSQYGASTKRGTNDQTGMLGLGCKSGLTYADQFIINAVKNGVHVSVVVSRTESGAGVMEILDTLVTDEPNGVEIVIPTRINDYSKFRDTVDNFFAYWPKGSVLVNSQPVKRFDETHEVIKMSDSLYLVKGLDDHRIVMGDVAYPVDFDQIALEAAPGRYDRYSRKWALVVYVGMGSVNFTPSREQLHMTRLTEATLTKIGKEFDSLILSKVESDIANAATHAEAWRKFATWRSVLEIKNLKPMYNGVEVTESIKIDAVKVTPGQRGGIHQGAGYLDHKFANSLFVTGLELTSTSQRKTISLWMDENGHNDSYFFLVGKPLDNPFFAESVTVDWETIKRETRKVRSIEYRKAAGTYPMSDPTNNGYILDLILPETNEIVWMRRSEKDYASPRQINNALPGHYIVILNENRVNKFQRDFPEVKHYKVAIREALEGTVDPKNKYDRLKDQVDDDLLKTISKWDSSKILDPAVVTLIEDCRKALDSKWNAKFSNTVAVASNFGLNLMSNETDGACVKPEIALAGYDFLAVDLKSSRWDKMIHKIPATHVADYINMVYEGTNND